MRIDPDVLETASMKDVLQWAIKKHDGERLERLRDYYKGNHDILNRRMKDETKPNNRLVNNLPGYITDTVVGYFMGKPVVYTGEDDYIEDLTGIFEANDEQDHNSEMAKLQSMQGVAYELLYTDRDAKIRMVELDDVIYIEAATIDKEPLMAIRPYKVDGVDGSTREYYDIYTDGEVITFEMVSNNNDRSLVEVDRYEHYFGEVPVIQYKNNAEKMGDYEGVMGLVDDYNRAQSDTANDLDYFTDAYLITTGAELSPDQVKLMKEQRVLNLPDKDCDARWLIKEINDTATENYKNRLREDIHTFSKVPDLTSDEFGTQLSGVAIAYRMTNLEQVCANKERKFKKGLQRRIKLISNILNAQGKQYDWRDIEITFARNMPQNLKELAEIVETLLPVIDKETLIGLLPFVENPADIMEKFEQQNDGVDLDRVVLDEPGGAEADGFGSGEVDSE